MHKFAFLLDFILLAIVAIFFLDFILLAMIFFFFFASPSPFYSYFGHIIRHPKSVNQISIHFLILIPLLDLIKLWI